MRRIGLAASKIAQGDLIKYNFFVIVISTLCAVLFFVVCGVSMALALLVVSFVMRWLLPSQFQQLWPTMIGTCAMMLVALVGVLHVIAIIKNIKFKIKS